ncbi:MAG: hypothetical protein IT392_00870 [Nitrospirae bacterium]|nr:hypothetical protein [Nitrospirota bacterium]
MGIVSHPFKYVHAKGMSSFTTTKITRHLLTNVRTVEQLMDLRIKIEGLEGEEGRVVRIW